MYRALSSFISNAADLLALEVEELAGILLMHLRGLEGAGTSICQNGLISQRNLVDAHSKSPEFGNKQTAVDNALMEAWAWLVSQGVLVQHPSQPIPWYFISRRGRRINSFEEFAEFRKGGLLPTGQLHPLIAAEVYPAFLRAKYDTAIFEAFREVEIAVRAAGKFEPTDYGAALMRDAFKPCKEERVSTPGLLTDTELPISEQEAMANLFAGAIGLFKNPQSHRRVAANAEDAAEIIIFASQLLRIVDRQKTRIAGEPTR